MLQRVRQAVGSLGLGGEAKVTVDDGALGLADGYGQARSFGAILEDGKPSAHVKFSQEFPVFRVFYHEGIHK